MSIDLDRIEFLAKLADDVVVAGYYDGEHLTPATVLALVAAARALPDDPRVDDGYGGKVCYACMSYLDSGDGHNDHCRWAIARAAMEGMEGAMRRPDAEAPAPISSETGAVSAIADHSSGESVPSAPDGMARPPDIHPAVEAAGAAPAFYRDLAIVGLIEHIEDLHRELGDLRGASCPFVASVQRSVSARVRSQDDE